MEKLNLSRGNLRKFAVTMAICFCIINLVIFLKHKEVNNVLIIISSLFLFAGIFIPQQLKVLYILWMRLAEAMGFLVSRIILSIIFLLILTPTGIILKIMGKDLLDRRLGGASSYWRKIELNTEDYERQF